MRVNMIPHSVPLKVTFPTVSMHFHSRNLGELQFLPTPAFNFCLCVLFFNNLAHTLRKQFSFNL